MTVDWAAVRAQFPALAGWAYLNTATFGQVPARGVEAVRAHFERRDRFACADFMDWFDEADEVRAAVARLVNCDARDVAFVQNASAAFSLLLGGLDWKPGDRIVTLSHEFPNHYYHPESLKSRGVEFVESDYEGIYEAARPGTRVVAVSTVSYATGFRVPLEEMAPRLRERGILLYVDGTQSVGALPFDIARIQPDMLAVHGYKWLLSPTGVGFMYVSPALRLTLDPAVIGWRSDRGWRDPENLRHGAPEFSPDAEKYEGGMLAFPLIFALRAALEMMLEIGAPAIEERVRELADGARDVLRRSGARLLCDEAPHYDAPIVCGRFPGADASHIARELKARRVLVSAREGNLRVSTHFYNDESDLQRLSEALRDLRL